MSDKDRSLIEITSDLGINHTVNKTAKNSLDSSRSEFFDAATKALEKGVLAKRTVKGPSTLEKQEDAESWATKWHPGWRVVGVEILESLPPQVQVQLEEDPAFKKFIFINPEDKQVYHRNAIQGVASLDDDALKADDMDLWLRISDPIPYAGLEQLEEFCEFAGISYETMMGWVEAKQSSTDWPRTLKTLDFLSNEDISSIQDYLVPSAISLRLESPRKAKPEDFEQDE